MGSIGTFGSFTTARLGIYTAQAGLQVTGNNISNINTVGYTRQNVDQISLRTGGCDRYQSSYSLNYGNGALATGISQVRDPYLDIRYRSTVASVGATDTKLAGLNDIAAIIDEVADGEDQNGIIAAQLSDLLDKLENLTEQTGHDEYDTQVRSSASALCTMFNSYAAKLEELYENTEDGLEQDVKTINGLLENIRDLNSSIRKSEIHGDNALELRDERNNLIDELSQYMKIEVIYSEEDIGAGMMVEKLTIKLADANPDKTVLTDSSTLIDGVYGTQLSVSDAVDNYTVTLSELTDAKGRVLDGSAAVTLDDNDLYGSLQATRELLTEAGEFSTQDTIANVDENAATKRGIQYYQKALDLLAGKIAQVFNEANNGYLTDENGNYLDANGDVLTIPADILADDTALADYLEANGAQPDRSGNLFSSRGDIDDAAGITAANISVSASWASGETRIVSSYTIPTGMEDVASTDNSNILHLVAMMDTDLDYFPSDAVAGADTTSMFKGSFGEMLTNIGAVLGNDQKTTSTMLDTYYASAVDLDTSRDSVSSVDLNDEATNLIQYQKAYSAACRLMTTLDQTLDKLINGTGVVGL